MQAPQGLALSMLPQPPEPRFVLSHLPWWGCQKKGMALEGTRPGVLDDHRLHPQLLLLHTHNAPDDLPQTSFILSFFPPWGSGLRCIPTGTQVSQHPCSPKALGRGLPRLPRPAAHNLAGSPGPCVPRLLRRPGHTWSPDASATEGAGSKGMNSELQPWRWPHPGRLRGGDAAPPSPFLHPGALGCLPTHSREVCAESQAGMAPCVLCLASQLLFTRNILEGEKISSSSVFRRLKKMFGRFETTAGIRIDTL